VSGEHWCCVHSEGLEGNLIVAQLSTKVEQTQRSIHLWWLQPLRAAARCWQQPMILQIPGRMGCTEDALQSSSPQTNLALSSPLPQLTFCSGPLES
jgi:hypothetical protein